LNTARASFYLKIILIAFISALVSWLVARYALHISVPTSFWVALGALLGLTLLIHIVLQKANALRPAMFVAYFMGSLTVKILFAGGLLITVGLLDRANLTFTAIGFFITYVLLTILEINSLIAQIRVDKGKN